MDTRSLNQQSYCSIASCAPRDAMCNAVAPQRAVLMPTPPEEQPHCPHRVGVLGYSHRMTFTDHPRLIGPMQRGTPAWQHLYAARSASERTNSYDQEVVAKAHPLRMRGLKAFRFAGAIRTLAQLLRRALNFVLDVTYTQGKTPLIQT